MTDETKPILSSDPKADTLVEVGAVENKRDATGDQLTGVRALRHFHKNGDLRGDMAAPGDEFETPRSRAAQLRANGLVEYTNESDDHAIHGVIDAGRITEKVKQRDEASKIPANSKGTPLRNPELKMAEVKDDKSSK